MKFHLKKKHRNIFLEPGGASVASSMSNTSPIWDHFTKKLRPADLAREERRVKRETEARRHLEEAVTRRESEVTKRPDNENDLQEEQGHVGKVEEVMDEDMEETFEGAVEEESDLVQPQESEIDNIVTMDAMDAAEGPPPRKRGRPSTGKIVGGTYCCAVGCHNCVGRDGARGVKFYQFPKDKKRCKQWITKVNRVGHRGSLWIPSKAARLCSEHFIGGRKSDELSSLSYLPTLFSNGRLQSQVQKREDRSERCRQREQKRDSLGSHNDNFHEAKSTASQQKDVVCNKCSKVFKNKRSLYAHMKEKHLGAPEVHLCPVCGASFGRKSNMKAHMLVNCKLSETQPKNANPGSSILKPQSRQDAETVSKKTSDDGRGIESGNFATHDRTVNDSEDDSDDDGKGSALLVKYAFQAEFTSLEKK